LYKEIWSCPEVDEDPYIFIYNAKAHPHLSTSEKLLISYNVNTFDFWDHFTNADIYRPRFITLELRDTLTNVEKKIKLPESFSLSQNTPNPFNSNTRIGFVLNENTDVVLKIYNLLGQEVRTLINNHLPSGSHSVFWNGQNNFGEKLCSGIYIYKIQTKEVIEYKKMLLLN
jgi:hypothetical protein